MGALTREGLRTGLFGGAGRVGPLSGIHKGSFRGSFLGSLGFFSRFRVGSRAVRLIGFPGEGSGVQSQKVWG